MVGFAGRRSGQASGRPLPPGRLAWPTASRHSTARSSRPSAARGPTASSTAIVAPGWGTYVVSGTYGVLPRCDWTSAYFRTAACRSNRCATLFRDARHVAYRLESCALANVLLVHRAEVPVPRQIRKAWLSAGSQDLSRGGWRAPFCDTLLTARPYMARLSALRGDGRPQWHGLRSVFLCIPKEDIMTAPHRKAVAKKSARSPAPRHAQDPPPPEPEAQPGSGWPGVVRYALENWPRTARLCVIVVVAGAVLLLAVMLGLRFWL
jgi:hypothetical protein